MARLFSTAPLTGIALSLLVLGSGSALSHNVCTVKPTPDGFVALRQKPSADGSLIVRMRPGDMVVIEKRGYEFVQSGNWWRASHYRGEVFPEPAESEFARVRKGWVNSRLIDDCG
jgi:hypothetical protein